jgi:hypothetical protein
MSFSDLTILKSLCPVVIALQLIGLEILPIIAQVGIAIHTKAFDGAPTTYELFTGSRV